MNIPNTLYRGVVLTYEQFLNYNFDAPLTPPNAAKINADGMKVVGDGNEYGVYMSDNYYVTTDAYGKPHNQYSFLIGNANPNLNRYYNEYNALPAIGIIYEIDSSRAINLREPWISEVLKGHYNNGFQGKEYIADEIPSDGFTIKDVIIGEDFLHTEECLTDFKETPDMLEKVVDIFEKRTKDLTFFINFINTLPLSKQEAFLQKKYDLRTLISNPNSFDLSKLDLSRFQDSLFAIYYLSMRDEKYLSTSPSDILPILSANKNEKIEKFNFNVNGKEISIYVSQDENNNTNILSQGSLLNSNTFLLLGSKALNNKLTTLVSKDIERALTDEERKALESKFKNSDEYDEVYYNENPDEILEESLIYEAKKRLSSMSAEQKTHYYQEVLRTLEKFQITRRNGDLELTMILPAGNQIKAQKQVLIDPSDNGTLNAIPNLLNPHNSPIKTNIPRLSVTPPSISKSNDVNQNH